MAIVGLIAIVAGAAGFLLHFTGNAGLVPLVEEVNRLIWAGVMLGGIVLVLLTRRPSD
jgi:hypothetical protein